MPPASPFGRGPGVIARSSRRLIPLLAVVGLAIAIGSGMLVPAPAVGPVSLPASSQGAGLPTPSFGPSSPRSPLPSPVPTGTVATRVIVPRLEIDLPVYEGDGFTATLGKAAHYPSTAWPGAGSLVYLYAHARDENFVALWKAKVGDRIQLHLVDGTTVEYEVSRILPNVRWDDLSMLDPTPSEVLRLQTCTSYGPTDPRFIVEAIPAGPA